jgi:thiamine pyrophosphokinase
MQPRAPFLILLGGELTPTQRLSRQVEGARVIAADNGIRHARTLGLTPELWVGDFDSSSDDLHAAFPDVPRDAYPAAKDMTDGEIAVEEALARGADGLVIAGALGGARSDHAMQNVLNGVALARRGIPVLMTSGSEEAWPVLPGRREIALEAGALFSVLAITDLSGLTLEGVRWPLSRKFVPMGGSLTLSNRVARERDTIAVTLEEGIGVLLARPDDRDEPEEAG